MIERSIVRVLRDDHLVGLAFVLDDHHVVTCAHVVNDALGRDVRDLSPAVGSHLLVELPRASQRPGDRHVEAARVVFWSPGDSKEWYPVRDIAVLRLANPVPEPVVRAPLLPGQRTGEVLLFGSDGNTRAVLTGEVHLHPDVLQVDETAIRVFEVKPGASGGPVWQPETGEVVGMLVAGERAKGPKTVYAIDAARVAAALSRVQDDVPPPPPPPPPDEGDPPAFLMSSLWRWSKDLWLYPVPVAGALVLGLVVQPLWSVLFGLVFCLVGVVAGVVRDGSAARRSPAGTALAGSVDAAPSGGG